MKKIIIILALSLMASQAFANGTATGTLSTSTTGLSAWGGILAASCTTLIGKTSTGVGLGWSVGPNGYSLVTQHKSGSRAFGTAYNSTSIFYADVTNVGTAVSTPTLSDQTAFNTGWTSM